MNDTPEDPVSRAVAALARVQITDLPPAAEEAWREASSALVEAVEERNAFMSVAHASMALVETVDDYESAIEDGEEEADEERIAALGEATAEAEDALVDALNELHMLITTDADLTGDVAYLAALDRAADDEEEPLQDREDR